MLVLTRKQDQVIHIGHDITITVTKVEANRVRLGINAPQDLAILRGELAEWHEVARDPIPQGEQQALTCG